jgi:sphingomyelin phosphodiesterase acid-like 3
MHLLFAGLLLGHWLLASDLHVQPNPGTAAVAGYGEDTNWALLQSTVAAMRRADPNPPVVIVSGDFLRHHFPHNTALAQQTMGRIVRTFNHAFPHAQFVIVPGNNDDPCGDYRVTPGSPYFARIAHLWAPLVNRNGAAPRFEKDFAQFGWYSAALPVRGLRVFALDTVYWSIVYRRCANYHLNAPQRELHWLANSIDALPKGTRALLVMHIPPGVDGQSTLLTHRFLIVPFLQQQYARSFVTEIGKRHARISFAIAGHVHRDDFRIFGDVPILVAPSVSPVYDNNPAFVQLDVTPAGSLQDYTPFDYSAWSRSWQAEPSFDETYGVSGFSASALESVHERLRTDADLRARWARMYMSGSRNRQITSDNWRTYWCAQTELADTFAACAGLQRRIEVLPIAAGVVGAALLAALALVAVRLGRARRRA